jgi:S-adenosylmethionine hydrolase
MLSIAPDAQIVDISHSVRKYAIRDGAFLLWMSLRWMPVGVHVAVVDPGVGTARRPVGLLTARGDVLVGPDNGLLRPAAESLGGIRAVRALERIEWLLESPSATFHGRDVFAPMAAHLAGGGTFEDIGPELDVASLIPLDFPEPVSRAGGLESSVLYVDSFGNLRLAGTPADLAAAAPGLRPGGRVEIEFSAAAGRPAIREAATWARTFGEVLPGSPVLYEDSFGRLAYADNQGNAAERLGVAEDAAVRIKPA